MSSSDHDPIFYRKMLALEVRDRAPELASFADRIEVLPNDDPRLTRGSPAVLDMLTADEFVHEIEPFLDDEARQVLATGVIFGPDFTHRYVRAVVREILDAFIETELETPHTYDELLTVLDARITTAAQGGDPVAIAAATAAELQALRDYAADRIHIDLADIDATVADFSRWQDQQQRLAKSWKLSPP